MKKIKASTLRAIVILAVTVVIAVGYFTKAGIGNLSALGWDVFSVLCPVGYLESLLASKTFVPRAFLSFLVIVVLVILLGRVFCAWVCPMPFMQRVIPGFKRKKRKEGEPQAADGAAPAQTVGAPEAPQAPEAPVAPAKPNRFKLDSRFGVLLGALVSATVFGFPVFCLVCPVGLAFAFVYLVMRLFAFGEVTWTVIVIPVFLLIEVVFLRKWCSRICPLGALMSLISGANKTLRPTIDDAKCINAKDGVTCFACSKNCPQDIDIRRPGLSEASLNNCTKCRECAEHCPGHAITFPFLPTSTRARAGEGGGAGTE